MAPASSQGAASAAARGEPAVQQQHPDPGRALPDAERRQSAEPEHVADRLGGRLRPAGGDQPHHHLPVARPGRRPAPSTAAAPGRQAAAAPDRSSPRRPPAGPGDRRGRGARRRRPAWSRTPLRRAARPGRPAAAAAAPGSSNVPSSKATSGAWSRRRGRTGGVRVTADTLSTGSAQVAGIRACAAGSGTPHGPDPLVITRVARPLVGRMFCDQVGLVDAGPDPVGGLDRLVVGQVGVPAEVGIGVRRRRSPAAAGTARCTSAGRRTGWAST